MALKYETFLSPFQGKNNNNINKSNKPFVLKTMPVESKSTETTQENFNKAPITFMPLPSPHLGNNLLKFPAFFKKIEEEEELEDFGASKTLKKPEKNEIQASKKNIFEEFMVIGLEKQEFIEKIDGEKTNDGFLPAKILYCYEKDQKDNRDW